MGGGSFSTVFQYQLDGNPVAVKIPNTIEFNIMQQHEIKLLKEANSHPNIIKFHCSLDVGDMRWIIMELMQGTVRDLLNKNSSLSWNTKLSLARQLLEGIAYLHCLTATHFTREGINHQDIKTENLLIDRLTDDPYIKLKISDFGIAKRIDQVTLPLIGNIFAATRKGNVGGTLDYAAPEIYHALCKRNENNELKSDVFSAGITLWEIATGQIPHRTMEEITQGRLNAFDEDKQRNRRVVSSSQFSKRLTKSEPTYPQSAFFGPVINKCIKKRPRDRYSAREAFEKLQQIDLSRSF
ncbi:serine/threonine-protein kinase [Legionella worsleiensis]|uniref:serine/threonine-protein kinase n=1 Tax=Legionella worsleiensis TaxID=45076 RepID=UPI001EE6D2E5|nr:serine/threonine-protein kinase [Legionella worsleiensis]